MSQMATFGARGQEAFGDGVADAARAAGDDRDAAGKVDGVHALILLVRADCSAVMTASPISRAPTRLQPGSAMSPVR